MGILKAYSDKTRGILIDEKWYHGSEAVMSFVKTIPKGSEVSVGESNNDGKSETILRLNVIKKAEGASYTPKEFIPAAQYQPSLAQRRNSSFAVSYAKDLAVAGKIGVNQIVEYAIIFERWMDEGIGPKEAPVPEESVK